MRAAHQKQTARQSLRSQSLAQCDIEARCTADQLSESARDSRAGCGDSPQRTWSEGRNSRAAKYARRQIGTLVLASRQRQRASRERSPDYRDRVPRSCVQFSC